MWVYICVCLYIRLCSTTSLNVSVNTTLEPNETFVMSLDVEERVYVCVKPKMNGVKVVYIHVWGR